MLEKSRKEQKIKAKQRKPLYEREEMRDEKKKTGGATLLRTEISIIYAQSPKAKE